MDGEGNIDDFFFRVNKMKQWQYLEYLQLLAPDPEWE